MTNNLRWKSTRKEYEGEALYCESIVGYETNIRAHKNTKALNGHRLVEIG